MPTPTTQIIALGSPHGADRLGWAAIEHLQQNRFTERFPAGALQLHTCPSPAQLPAMIIPGARLVLIDALGGIEAGVILQLSIAQLKQENRYASSHGLTLSTMLPLIEQLYGVMTGTVIIGIGMGDGAVSTLPDAAWGMLEKQLDEVVRGAG